MKKILLLSIIMISLAYSTALSVLGITIYFSIIGRGVLIYYWEPKPLVVALEIPQFIMSTIVLSYIFLKWIREKEREISNERNL